MLQLKTGKRLLQRNYVIQSLYQKCRSNYNSFACYNYGTFLKSLYRKNKENKPFLPAAPVARNTWNIFNKLKFGTYAIIKKPAEVIESQDVPDFIEKPPYAKTGEPLISPDVPEIKTPVQIEGMRCACRVARSILNYLSVIIKVGMTTEEIDMIVRKKSFEAGSYPSPLNYRGFPKSCCTSVNNVACHGIPDSRPLEEGDIVSVDITVFHKGYHGDCCETFLIGNVDDKGRHLVEVAKQCRDRSIEICGPGVPFVDIGEEVETIAKDENFVVVPAFTGHGIGHYFHGPPDIYHCYNNYPGIMMPGMTFTIEPVIAQGSREIIILEDGWTAVTLDNGRAAQFEHTILITANGHEILT